MFVPSTWPAHPEIQVLSFYCSHMLMHTNVVTCDRMRHIVVVQSKPIENLQQSATSNIFWFLYTLKTMH